MKTISEFVCPNCNAQPGQPCTTPTINSREPVRWFHLSRERLAKEQSYEDQP
jgi:hypothetical protein